MLAELVEAGASKNLSAKQASIALGKIRPIDAVEIERKRIAIEFCDEVRHADLALDDSAGTRGSVIYRVFLEREAGDWQSAYESPIVRGGEPPLPLSLDVTGALRLALIVDFADRGDELDHANWLNARLVK